MLYKMTYADYYPGGIFWERTFVGWGQVFETVRYAKDKEKLSNVMEENREIYSRIDSETRKMLEVVANVKIPEKYRIVENGEEMYNMCQAFLDMRLEGYEEGIAKGITEGIEKRALIETCKSIKMARLIMILMQSDREEDLERVLTDEEYREQLLRELEL